MGAQRNVEGGRFPLWDDDGIVWGARGIDNKGKGLVIDDVGRDARRNAVIVSVGAFRTV